jgi:D-alanine transaminase
LLWVQNGRLEGTPEGHEILPGMTRQLVLRLTAELNVSFSGTRVRLDELLKVEELILVGTTTEVVPVVQVDGQKIGAGQPGRIARRLHQAYEAAVQRWLDEGQDFSLVNSNSRE